MGQMQPRISEDGRFYWDGQAWKPMPAAQDGTAVSRSSGLLMLGGAALVVVGSFLPWITATAPFVGTVSRSLMDGGSDGVILDTLAGVVLFMGLAMTLRGPTRLGGGLAILTLILVTGIVVFDYSDMQSRVSNATSESNLIIASVGAGPYASGIGVLVAAIGSVMALLSRRLVTHQAMPTSARPVEMTEAERLREASRPTEPGARLGTRSLDGDWYWNGERWLPNS